MIRFGSDRVQYILCVAVVVALCYFVAGADLARLLR